MIQSEHLGPSRGESNEEVHISLCRRIFNSSPASSASKGTVAHPTPFGSAQGYYNIVVWVRGWAISHPPWNTRSAAYAKGRRTEPAACDGAGEKAPLLFLHSRSRSSRVVPKGGKRRKGGVGRRKCALRSSPRFPVGRRDSCFLSAFGTKGKREGEGRKRRRAELPRERGETAGGNSIFPSDQFALGWRMRRRVAPAETQPFSRPPSKMSHWVFLRCPETSNSRNSKRPVGSLPAHITVKAPPWVYFSSSFSLM